MALIKVKIPKMGMTTEEVDVVALHVKPGDRIAPGMPLAEVESEKTTMVIEAEVEGIVREIFVEAGAESAVGNVICSVEV
jgi:pyruvate dehydrogenase E2 component (dihydrolipoamide acetyltransferase)